MLLDDVKHALRITNPAFDVEVADLIASAQHDLILAGVLPERANDDTDPNIKKAIITYAKANFGYDNPEADRFQRSFDSIKMRLAITKEYVVIEPDETP